MTTTTPLARRSIRMDLSPEAEVAILARALYRDAYDEHNNGHISYKQPDGTLLVTPRGLAWDELHASDIMRVTPNGEIIEGEWDVSPALSLHYALHRLREATVAIHHHPQYSTVWACTDRVPPVYDQSSAYLGGPLVMVKEYAGEVFDDAAAASTVAAMNGADSALLGNHGVLVLADSIRRAHQRAVALEWRCQLAWRVESLGMEHARPLSEASVAGLEASINGRAGFLPYLFDSMARREIRLDPSVLD